MVTTYVLLPYTPSYYLGLGTANLCLPPLALRAKIRELALLLFQQAGKQKASHNGRRTILNALCSFSLFKPLASFSFFLLADRPRFITP